MGSKEERFSPTINFSGDRRGRRLIRSDLVERNTRTGSRCWPLINMLEASIAVDRVGGSETTEGRRYVDIPRIRPTVSPGMCLIEITASASCRIADTRRPCVSPNVFPARPPRGFVRDNWIEADHYPVFPPIFQHFTKLWNILGSLNHEIFILALLRTEVWNWNKSFVFINTFTEQPLSFNSNNTYLHIASRIDPLYV